MAEACIRIELSEGGWKTDLSRTYADVRFRILSTVLDDGRATETVVLSGCEIAGCLSEFETHPEVDAFDTVDRHEGRATVQIETLEPAILSAAARAGTPLVYPAVVNDGELTTTVVGTHTGISSLGDQLRATGLEFEVEYVRSEHAVGQVLTDRQEEVLLTAIEHGYYRSPREASLTEVADILGIAKSTCSATLQRAEESVVKYFCRQRRRSNQVTTEGSGVPIDGYSSS